MVYSFMEEAFPPDEQLSKENDKSLIEGKWKCLKIGYQTSKEGIFPTEEDEVEAKENG